MTVEWSKAHLQYILPNPVMKQTKNSLLVIGTAYRVLGTVEEYRLGYLALDRSRGAGMCRGSTSESYRIKEIALVVG